MLQLFETDTAQHIGIGIKTTETIDTNNKRNKICSVEFVKLENLTEILLVGGRKNFGLQIYFRQKNNNKSKHILKNTLQFEDQDTYNSTIITDKHIFVKA